MDSGARLDKTHRYNPTEGPDGPTGPWNLPFLTLFLPPSATALGITNKKAIIEAHQTHAAHAAVCVNGAPANGTPQPHEAWCPCPSPEPHLRPGCGSADSLTSSLLPKWCLCIYGLRRRDGSWQPIIQLSAPAAVLPTSRRFQEAIKNDCFSAPSTSPPSLSLSVLKTRNTSIYLFIFVVAVISFLRSPQGKASTN